MRVLEGHTFASRHAFLANLGQASAVPALSPVREAIVPANFPHMYWGRFADSADGARVVKIGQAVSNTPYFSFLPTGDIYLALVSWIGENAGKAAYVPVSSFPAQYRILTKEDESIVRPLLPAMDLEDRTFKRLYDDAGTAYQLAQNALSNAELGDIKTASMRLDARNVGARALRDSAYVTLRLLEDVGLITRDEGMEIRKEAFFPLSDAINEAGRAIGRSKSEILSLIDRISRFSKLTAVQLHRFASGKWEELKKVFKALYNVIDSFKRAIAAIETNVALGGPRTEELKTLLEGLKKDYAALDLKRVMIEQKAVASGVSLDEFKRELGLGDLGVVPPVVAAGLMILAFTLAGVVLQIIDGFSNAFKGLTPGMRPTHIPPPGVAGGLVRLCLSDQELDHRLALQGAGPDVEKYAKVAKEAKEAIGDVFRSMKEAIDRLKGSSPGLVDDETGERFENALQATGLGVAAVSPWPYVGAAAGGLGLSLLIRFFPKRK